MPIRIVGYCREHEEQVRAFNRRLRAGGRRDAFSDCAVPRGLPPREGRRLYQEYFLAVDDESEVRGAYLLKHQEFWVGGRTLALADFALPISEGVVNRSYAQVGVKLLMDALHRQPLLYGLGMGGYAEPITRLLEAAHWSMFSVPFYFRILRPFPFLRNIAHLRRSAPGRCLADLLAFSGLGAVAIKAWNGLHHRKLARDDSLSVETVDEFTGWADELWEACRHEYGMSAVRDGETLRILYPKKEQRFIRLKVARDGKVVGWAVLLDTQLAGHKQFGNMRLGSIVDCFAAASQAGKVIGSARALLQSRGVDLIVSNQAHHAWCRALAGAGFLRGPSNFIFACSPKLAQLLESSGVRNRDVHMNRGDGDGPINL